MEPIQNILNRIKWDKEFAKADFKIGYHDRFNHKIIYVPFTKIHFLEENHFMFEVTDDMGEMHSIPFHRVREVYKDEILIWERKVEE